MQIKRTIPITIKSDSDLLQLVAECSRFRRAISETAYNGGTPLSAFDLHKAVYYAVPANLPSQMKCSAIRSVATAYSVARKNRRPADHAFVFRREIALFLFNKDFSFVKGKLSIITAAGRKRVDFDIPAYAKADFTKAVSYNSLTVTGTGRIALCLTLEVPEPAGNSPVGIDLGATNALVASTATDTLFVSGLANTIRNRRTRKTRQRLQSKLAGQKAQKHSTRSVRRVLKRLGRKQSNRNRTFCRETAARLCKWAPKDAVLVFEDLRIKQVRKGRKQRKGTRRRLSQWFYDTVTQACISKAERLGMAVGFIDPAYTSQRCCRCGKLGERRGHRFSCECGHKAHADVNASHNIRLSFTVLRSSGPPSTGPEALSRKG